ncbi:hypothetical protein HYT01_03930 [Candidatus Giovannonibacteria bacterium]|nr:hypothetical protein [Candidatus Giovannonibacteria bacterium]
MRSIFTRWRVMVGLAGIALGVIVFYFFYSPNQSFAEYALQVVEKCSEARHRPSCYDEEIPKLMDKISMNDAFTVTKEVQKKDPEYFYCHVLGHKLSAQETAKDPDKWKEVVASCPAGVCSNGCIHGAFQERFRAEALPPEKIKAILPDLKDVCEKRAGWNPTQLEQATCYHALGHLMMYITSADINQSVALCRNVAKKGDGRDISPLCFDGAFMQIFQPLEPEDFALVEGKVPAKKELVSFCKKFSGEEENSCWTEGWPLFAEEVKTPKGLVEFCNHFSEEARIKSCLTDLFFIMTAQLGLDTEKVREFCAGVSAPRRGQCFATAVSRFIETDQGLAAQAVGLCGFAEKSGNGEECYDMLLSLASYDFHAGSQEVEQFCDLLPAPWKDQCR